MDLNSINQNVNRLLQNTWSVIAFLREYSVDSAKDVSILYTNKDGSESKKTFPNIAKQITSLENMKNNVSNAGLGLKKYQEVIGRKSDYSRAVIPLVSLKNDNINSFSYTSGKIEMVRPNGCCIQSPIIAEFKAIKKYSLEDFDFYKINVSDNYIKPCKFMYGGKLYGGIEVYYNVQSNYAIFTGVSNCKLNYIPYVDVRDNSVKNQEIFDSLVILGD